MTDAPAVISAGRRPAPPVTWLLLLGVTMSAAAQSAAPAPSAVQPNIQVGPPLPGDPAPPGVANPRRAWQNWTLNCQGCHRPDGTGSATTAPPLAGTVSKFLTVPGGREYLGRVPGVATSPFNDAELAELMNWMFWRFDREHIPAGFVPFTALEIGRLRAAPLRLEATPLRTALLKQAEAGAQPKSGTGAP